MERLHKIGTVKTLTSAEVTHSKLGIGFEKLDRAVFDPSGAYDHIGKLGIKPIRLQSGWARTEKEKGVYDFSWLDEIVDALTARGLEPWVCLCYGNGLYDEAAAKVFGAVGCPPIFTEEQKQAWKAYVEALVRHFRDRVRMWEVWNEPDGVWCWKHGPSGTEYGRFVVDTAEAIRRADADAYVIGGSICIKDNEFLTDALNAGMGDVINGLTFHEYTPDERSVFKRVQVLRALVHSYNPKIEIIQGESGSQSRSDGCGALRGGAWTPKKQAKQLLRHETADMLTDVKFSSYFTTVDMIEALNGTVGDKASYLDYGYFGVLGADFDENGIACGTYTPKPSYYAFRNLAALFADGVEVTELPVWDAPSYSQRVFHEDFQGSGMISGSFVRTANCAYAYTYWNPSDLMTTEFFGTVSFAVSGKDIPLSDIHLIDPLDGSVYEIPESMMRVGSNGKLVRFDHLPVTDYPLFLTFGDYVGIEPLA